MVDTAHIDVTNPQFKANPYPIYEQLRREAPVCRVRVGRWLSPWLITRYDDVVTALKDERFTKDPWKAQLAFQQMWIFWLSGRFAHHMLSSDEPDHTRLRNLVQRAFTPRLVGRPASKD